MGKSGSARPTFTRTEQRVIDDSLRELEQAKRAGLPPGELGRRSLELGTVCGTELRRLAEQRARRRRSR